MKYKLFLITSILLLSHYSFCQQKIRPGIKLINMLGKSPYKVESNCVPETLLRMVYSEPTSRNNSKIGFMDRKGKTVIKPIYNMASDFYNGYANIIKESTFGYIDKKGVEVLFKDYEETYFYYNNTGIAKKNGKEGLIDRNGKPLTEFKYNMITFFGFNHFSCQISKNVQQILDSNGKIVFNKNLDYHIKSYYFEKDSLLVYEKKIDNKPLKGIVKIDETIIIEPKYDEIYTIENQDFFVVLKDEKFGLINNDGQEIVPLMYDEIGSNINETLIPVKQKGKWGFINTQNKIIIPFEYNDVNPFFENIAFVQKENSFGAIDKTNKIKVPFDLENSKFLFYSDNLCVIKEKGKYGYINKDSKIVIPAIYDYAYPFVNGIAYVELGDKSGFIDKKGKEIIPIKYKQLWLESENLIRFVE